MPELRTAQENARLEIGSQRGRNSHQIGVLGIYDLQGLSYGRTELLVADMRLLAPDPRCRLFPPLWADSFLRSQASKHAAGERSAAPFSPQFCTCAPTAERRCPLGSVLADEQPHRSRFAAVSRSERSAQAP